MIIVEAFKEFWKRAINYKGRTKRNIYWWSILANSIVALIIEFTIPDFSLFFLIAYILASISMGVRRVRDVGLAWYIIFICLVPVLGPIIYFVFECLPSDTFNRNRYDLNKYK